MNENRIASLKAERNVFALLEGDYVVKAVYTFTHENYICFVMEYMIGGDFASILEKYGYLDEDIAKFYIAELMLATESLHKVGVVHRDLKPDNVLLDAKGHAKLADFGLSEIGLDQKRQANNTPIMNASKSPISASSQNKIEKFNQLCDPSKDTRREVGLLISKNHALTHAATPNKSYIPSSPQIKKSMSSENSSPYSARSPFKSSAVKASNNSTTQNEGNTKKIRMVGTPDYMAPEIILGYNNTDKSIDWWAVGVIVYEFLIGIPPFNDETVEKVFDNIENLRMEWPTTETGEEFLSKHARSLIAGLLTLNPKKRLGYNGFEEIKNHPFFKGTFCLFY